MTTTKSIQRIVVGVDGSADSDAALKWAIAVAKDVGSHITAVFAFRVSSDYPDEEELPERFHDGWRRSMRAQFENVWCRPLRAAGIPYRAVMPNGRPVSAINRIADREKADIIVVGRRGRGRVAELFLGSVSHELVLRSQVPVVVTNRGVGAGRPGRSSTPT